MKTQYELLMDKHDLCVSASNNCYRAEKIQMGDIWREKAMELKEKALNIAVGQMVYDLA